MSNLKNKGDLVKLAKQVLLTLFAGFVSLSAYADHPNEGHIAISQLIAEAESQSLEIKKAEENLKVSKSKLQSSYGAFVPKISLEGGPQISKFDSVQENGTSLFGKAEWNIFNGGRDKSLTELHKDEFNLQEKQLQQLKNKIKRNVSRIYYELQFLLEKSSLLEKALALNSQQMKIAKAKNSSGFTSSSDVLEFDLRESTLKSDLVLLNQQLIAKSKELDVILSRDSIDAVEAVKGHLERIKIEPNRSEILSKAQKNNTEINAVELELARARLDNDLALSQFSPKLDLEAKYGKLASEETVFDKNDNYTVSLKLSIPLFSGFSDYNNLKAAKALVSSAEKDKQQKSLAVTSELDTVITEIKALNQRLDIEEKNLERSETYYKLSLEEYRRGVKNSPDIVGASERLIDARIRNLEYRRDLILAQLKLEEISGY